MVPRVPPESDATHRLYQHKWEDYQVTRLRSAFRGHGLPQGRHAPD